MSEQFSFNLNNKLKKTTPKDLKTNNYKNIFTLFYTVKVSNNIPYLLILFEKQSNKLLKLPEFNKQLSYDKNVSKIKKSIKNIGNTKLNNVGKQDITLQGSLEHNSELYLFFNCKNLADIYTYKVNDKYFWCSLYEVINFQHFLKYNIFKKHAHFFTENYEKFLFKLGKNNINIPMQIYLELTKDTNIVNLINNYDTKLGKKYVVHTNNIKKNKKMIRCLLFSDEHCEIKNNKLLFDNNNSFIIISIFE